MQCLSGCGAVLFRQCFTIGRCQGQKAQNEQEECVVGKTRSGIVEMIASCQPRRNKPRRVDNLRSEGVWDGRLFVWLVGSGAVVCNETAETDPVL